MGLYKFWEIQDKLNNDIDCFIVLSYAVKNKNEPTKPSKVLLNAAHGLWKKFPNAKIIMSTGDNQNLGVSNAKILANWAIKLGVPRNNIIEEDKSLTTWENLINSKKIVERLKFKNPCLIVLDLHARRAIATAEKLGWGNLSWISVYAKGEPAYGIKRFQTFSRVTIFFYELAAFLFSKIRGWA